ncbi:MAG TPA: ATPase, T2SS/T4P/T4SS family [Pirellulales bacterium]|nr:ATPase, T2SS/T4P/T4SS family [Pirellulales bacterium]
MHRLFILVLAVLWSLADAQRASAQDFGTFPSYPGLDANNITTFPVGPGFYLSWIKILVCWVIFLLWVRSTDWMSRDATTLRLDYKRWNLVAFFTFVAALILLWTLPWFWLDMPLMLVAWAAPFFAYVAHRNSKVTIDETVFTPGHIRFWLSENLKVVGIKIAAESTRRGKGPPVDLKPQGKDERTNTANLLLARQTIGYPLTQALVAEVIGKRVDGVLMDFTQASVAMRYQIDGVWHDAEARDRESGDAMLAVMKTIAGLDAKQRVKRQEGTFGAEFEKVKYTCKVLSQGTKTGERALLQLQGRKQKLERLVDLDMRPKLIEDLKAVLSQPQGMIVVSTPPAGGLSTLFPATIREMDRFVRGFVGIESAATKELDVENVVVTLFDPAAGQNPAAVLPKIIREHPDVYVVPDMVDAESATMLCEQVQNENRMVVTSVRAKEVADSLLQVLRLKVPPAQFGPAVVAAVNQRLIRKLCPKCKEAFAPTAQLLEQLGIPAGRIEALYRTPQQPEEVCTECQGIGYIGRTGIFEVLIVDDNVRQALTTNPQLAAVRQAARRAGMRTLQEEGIVLVAKGITSLQELMRVLKE